MNAKETVMVFTAEADTRKCRKIWKQSLEAD
jgi:hypothetical protein